MSKVVVGLHHIGCKVPSLKSFLHDLDFLTDGDIIVAEEPSGAVLVTVGGRVPLQVRETQGLEPPMRHTHFRPALAVTSNQEFIKKLKALGITPDTSRLESHKAVDFELGGIKWHTVEVEG